MPGPCSTAMLRPPKLEVAETSGTSRRAASTRLVTKAGRVKFAKDRCASTGVLNGVMSTSPDFSAAIDSAKVE